MEQLVKQSIKPSLDSRVSELEVGYTVATAQFKLTIVLGVFFWGIISGVVYKKLDSIDQSIEKINAIDRTLNLLEYRQSQQEIFNGVMTTAQERNRAEIENKFSRLTDRLNTMQRGN